MDTLPSERRFNSKSLQLKWSQLHYEVKIVPSFYQKVTRLVKRQSKQPLKKTNKIILENVSGQVSTGQLIAILGPSGAGKSTLLNLLAGRVQDGKLSGSIRINEKPRTAHWKDKIGYVEQMDNMYEFLTVRESLKTAAYLRLPAHLAKEEKKAIVNEVILNLGLFPVQNSRIDEISGGQRKRVSIGIELVSNPDCLLLDEPTSGLDSYTAMYLVELLRNLADSYNKLILLTIHQPRYKILQSFDKVVILSEGKTVFFGPVDGAIGYFDENGFMLPEMTNPADFFLDTITLDFRTPENELKSKDRVKTLQIAWENFESKNCDDSGAQMVTNTTITSEQTQRPEKKKRINFFSELYILLIRNFKNNFRNAKLLIAQFSQLFVMILLLGLPFLQLGYGQGDIQNRVGVLFFLVINSTFTVITPYINLFPLEKKLIIKERASNTFRLMTFYISKVLAGLPVLLTTGFILTTALYWMIGLKPTAGAYTIFVIFYMTLAFCSQALGLAIGAIAPDVQIGQVIGPIVILVFVIFGGNFLNADSIPGYLVWIYWISPIHYAYQGAMINEFSGQTFICDRPGCLETGEEVLEAYGLDNLGLWTCFLILLGFIAAFHTLAFFLLRYSTKLTPIVSEEDRQLSKSLQQKYRQEQKAQKKAAKKRRNSDDFELTIAASNSN